MLLLILMHRLCLLLWAHLNAQLRLRVGGSLRCLLWGGRVLLHKCHVTLPDLNKLLLNHFFLCLILGKLLLHASENLRVSLQVADCLVSLELILLCLIGQPAHVRLELLVLNA